MLKSMMIILIILSMIMIIPNANAEYYTNHKWYHTFDVITPDVESDGVHPDIGYSATVDQYAIDQAVKLWKDYGINLVQVKSGGDFHIKFAYFCEIPYLGYYDEDSRNAVIFTYCHRQDISEDLKVHIIAHEVGHALGWSHSSDPWFMKSS